MPTGGGTGGASGGGRAAYGSRADRFHAGDTVTHAGRGSDRPSRTATVTAVKNGVIHVKDPTGEVSKWKPTQLRIVGNERGS